jgi:hypothetical protein
LQGDGAFQQAAILAAEVVEPPGQQRRRLAHRALGRGAVLRLRGIGRGEGIRGGDLGA